MHFPFSAACGWTEDTPWENGTPKWDYLLCENEQQQSLQPYIRYGGLRQQGFVERAKGLNSQCLIRSRVSRVFELEEKGGVSLKSPGSVFRVSSIYS